MKARCRVLAMMCMMLFCQNIFSQVTDQCSNAIGRTSKDAKELVIADCTLPYNEENAFDSAGIYHNQAMDFVSKETNGEFDKTMVYELSSKFISQTFGKRCPAMLKIQPDKAVIEAMAANPEDFQVILDKSAFSQTAKNYLKELVDLLLSQEKIYNQYCDLKNEIIVIERKIIQDRTINNSAEVATILSIAAIARHSGYYWHKQFPTSADSQGKFRLFRWLFVAAMDTIGGIAGGGTLGPAGAVGAAIFFSTGGAAASTP